MDSEMFKLKARDFVKAVINAILTGAALAVVGIWQQPDFNVFSADWYVIGQMATNGAFAGFVGYLVKNFLSDSEGKIFGRIG